MHSTITYALIASSFLLAAVQASPLDATNGLYGRNALAPNTGDIIAILNAQGLSNWTDDDTGAGKYAYFPHDVWNAAETEAVRKIKLRNASKPHHPHNSTDEHPHHRHNGTKGPRDEDYNSAIQRRSDGVITEGISDAGGTRHKAHWVCYGSGSVVYNQILGTVNSILCGGLAKALEGSVTGQWIWTPNPATAGNPAPGPGPSVREMWIKVSKWGAITIATSTCSAAIKNIIDYNCRLPNDATETQGGVINIYSEPTSTWPQGTQVAQIDVHPVVIG